LRVDGNHLVMVFTAPDGDATFRRDAERRPPGVHRHVNYNGQQISVAARKRP